MSRFSLSTKRSEPSDAGRADARSAFDAGDRFRERREWAQAADAYARGLALDPKNFAVTVQYGHALKEAGRLTDAGEAYLRAEGIDAEDHDLPIHLGHLNAMMGNIPFAEAYYERAFVKGSMDAHAFASLKGPVNVETVTLLFEMRPALQEDRNLRSVLISGGSFAAVLLLASNT